MNAEILKPLDLFDLAGKSALVTGGTGALGKVAAQALASAGATVALAGANRNKLNEIVSEIEASGGKARGVNLRPDSEENADKMIDQAIEFAGGIDILVVASGYNKPGNAFETSLADFDAVQDANVRQTWLICRSAGKAMIERGLGGKMVITSSVRGIVAADNATAYCSSKAATDMLVKCFATEFGGHGITVNSVAPTVFRSPLTSWLYDEEGKGTDVRKMLVKRIPMGRLAEPEDFVGPVVFLSSKASDFMTGHTMYVDGGFVIN